MPKAWGQTLERDVSCTYSTHVYRVNMPLRNPKARARKQDLLMALVPRIITDQIQEQALQTCMGHVLGTDSQAHDELLDGVVNLDNTVAVPHHRVLALLQHLCRSLAYYCSRVRGHN
jgi:hypothetical protein